MLMDIVDCYITVSKFSEFACFSLSFQSKHRLAIVKLEFLDDDRVNL